MNSNQLKLIAMISMTIDHVGMILFPEVIAFRIIGRIAFPIFAYMIAEGCRYTKDRKKYLLTLLGLGVICQIVSYVAEGSLYQCVLISFSLAVGLIYLYDYAVQSKKLWAWTGFILAIAMIGFLCEILPTWLPDTDFAIDYGVFGILLIFWVYTAKDKKTKLIYLAISVALLSLDIQWVQWYSLASVPLIACYNGERGKYNLKYLFYIFYPFHLAIVYAISLVL